MTRRLCFLLGLVGLVLLLSAAGFVIWGETPAAPMPEALSAMQSNAQVAVSQGSWLVFTPVASEPVAGLIFYPGGRVDYRSYAPAARKMAEEGYLVVIVRMPLNLAVLNANAAERVIRAYPQIEEWAVGGHSLGGAMAANFAANHAEAVDGLVLWAAYPASSDDLSSTDLRVVSIYGTLDGLATDAKIDASRLLLPPDSTWVPVEGGNHAQFGWYGEQAGDNPAALSRSDQQEQIVAATLAFMESLK